MGNSLGPTKDWEPTKTADGFSQTALVDRRPPLRLSVPSTFSIPFPPTSPFLLPLSIAPWTLYEP